MSQIRRTVSVAAAAGCLLSVAVLARMQVGAVSGTVRDEQGRPVAGVSLAIFPAEAALWTVPDSAARMRLVAVAEGPYVFSGLQAGEYRVGVLNEAMAREWPAADLLGRLVKRAFPLRVGSGETHVDIIVSLAAAEPAIVTATMARGVSVPMGRAGPMPSGAIPPQHPPPVGPAALSGRLSGADGQALPDVEVRLMVPLDRDGFATAGFTREPVKTDAQGRYRFSGLTARDYLVVVVSHAQTSGLLTPYQLPPRAGADGRGYVTTFYPGVTTIEKAKTIRLDASEISGVDFVLQDAPMREVVGSIARADSLPVPVTLVQPEAGGINALRAMVTSGQFRFDHVAFGEYHILANGPAGAVRSTLKVDSALQQPLTLRFEPLISVSGRVVFRGDRPAPSATELAKFQVRLAPAPPLSGSPLVSSPIRPDGSFSFRAAAGRYRLVVIPLPPWIQASGRIGGVEAMKTPVALISDVTDAEVALVVSTR